jgi:hypothetical protein
MRWEIENPVTPELGDVRFITKFAWLPTRVLSKITMTDHRIWLELYVEEQEYKRVVVFDNPTAFEDCWVPVGKTIHT